MLGLAMLSQAAWRRKQLRRNTAKLVQHGAAALPMRVMKDHGAFNEVLELPNVARPGISVRGPHYAVDNATALPCRRARPLHIQSPRDFVSQMRGQQRQITLAFAQRRQP